MTEWSSVVFFCKRCNLEQTTCYLRIHCIEFKPFFFVSSVCKRSIKAFNTKDKFLLFILTYSLVFSYPIVKNFFIKISPILLTLQNIFHLLGFFFLQFNNNKFLLSIFGDCAWVALLLILISYRILNLSKRLCAKYRENIFKWASKSSQQAVKALMCLTNFQE